MDTSELRARAKGLRDALNARWMGIGIERDALTGRAVDERAKGLSDALIDAAEIADKLCAALDDVAAAERSGSA